MSDKKGDRFKILVCIDGSDESYRGLRYAVRIGSGLDADITLLYVRPLDQGLSTGGLQIDVARSNVLDWGLELPGMRTLKTGRNMLLETGFLGADWDEKTFHEDVRGDPLGDNIVEYRSEDGKKITLKLLVATSVAHGILDEADYGGYDITIIAFSKDRMQSRMAGFIGASVAQTVATEHTGTVMVARELEESHGHLLCVMDNEESIRAALKDAQIASRCNCPITLFSVASDESKVESAEAAIAKAKTALAEAGIPIMAEKIAVGDPVEQIILEGRTYSVIVVSASSRKGLRRLFSSSIGYQVLREAPNSVMVAR